MGIAQMIDELDFRLEQRPGQSRAVVAAEHAVLAAVVHAEVHFQRRLGREHFFAQHAPVKVLRVRFHEVFLDVFGRRERSGTLLARIFGCGHQEVADDMLLVVFEVRKRQMTVRTWQLNLIVVGVNAVVVVVVVVVVVIVVVVDGDAQLRGRTGHGRPRQLQVFAVVHVVAADAFLFYVTLLVGRWLIAAGRRTGLLAGRVVPLVVRRLVLPRRRVMVLAATVLGRRQRQVCGTRLNGFLRQKTTSA